MTKETITRKVEFWRAIAISSGCIAAAIIVVCITIGLMMSVLLMIVSPIDIFINLFILLKIPLLILVSIMFISIITYKKYRKKEKEPVD